MSQKSEFSLLTCRYSGEMSCKLFSNSPPSFVVLRSSVNLNKLSSKFRRSLGHFFERVHSFTFITAKKDWQRMVSGQTSYVLQ